MKPYWLLVFKTKNKGTCRNMKINLLIDKYALNVKTEVHKNFNFI